jgi:transcriptional repressor NrdR
MKCPFCGHLDSQVKDSRPSDDGSAIKRRRYCAECDSRFTTFERVILSELMVVKNNGQRKPLDRDKIYRSISIATRKRPVSAENLEELVSKIIRKLEMSGENEITSAMIGELVMEGLLNLDKVAYIRYASVYRNFREAKDFEEFVDSLQGTVKAPLPSNKKKDSE